MECRSNVGVGRDREPPDGNGENESDGELGTYDCQLRLKCGVRRTWHAEEVSARAARLASHEIIALGYKY